MSKFIVSQKRSPNGVVLVVTDADLLGKKFEEGKLQLDLTSKFYHGEERSEEEILALFTAVRHLHLTGKDSVELGRKKQLVDEEKILYVAGIPHAEVFMGE